MTVPLLILGTLAVIAGGLVLPCPGHRAGFGDYLEHGCRARDTGEGLDFVIGLSIARRAGRHRPRLGGLP